MNYLFFITFTYWGFFKYVFWCLWQAWGCTCTTLTWRSEGNLQELALPLHSHGYWGWDSRCQARQQVILPRAVLLAHGSLCTEFLSLLYTLCKLAARPFDRLFAWDRLSLSRPDWPRTVFSPASASEVLGLQAWAAMPANAQDPTGTQGVIKRSRTVEKSLLGKALVVWKGVAQGSGLRGGEDREIQSTREGRRWHRVWGAHMSWTWWSVRSDFCLWPGPSRRYSCSY